jgi:HlyD family secretion protein
MNARISGLLLAIAPALIASMLIAGCERDDSLRLPGSTDWDRIAILAEASEPVVEWFVAEGDRVEPGDRLLRLDATRQDARLAEAFARLAEAEAALDELVAGPRQESIARARAELASAEAAVVETDLRFDREEQLLRRDLTSQSSVDQARATRDQRRASVTAARAALDELVAGTRSEQLAQVRARVASIRAEITGLELTRERYGMVASRSGRVDALPFRPGDQPRVGDVLASLLVGDAPIARIFVPANVRAEIDEGDLFSVRVEGVDAPLQARLRSIRSEASFTPYYALTGDDASRLVYRAELVFTDAAAADLPAGLPLVATPVATPVASANEP